MIKILIADSYDLSRSGLVSLISNQSDLEIVCQTTESNLLMSDIHYHQPDVVIADIQLNPNNWVNTVRLLKHSVKTRFLILANKADDPLIIQLLQAGAQGCVQKSIGEDHLILAIHDVFENKSPISPNIAYHLLQYIRNNAENRKSDCLSKSSLTHREFMVLQLLSEGTPNKMIGNKLDISDRTVEAHVRNILKKLNATSRTHAAYLALQNGWL